MPANPEHTLLVGAAGTGTAFGLLTSARRHWSTRVKLVGMDVEPSRLVTSSILCDRFYQVPFSDSPEFLPALERIVREEGVDTYMPLLPGESVLAATWAASTAAAQVKVLTGNCSAAEIASDKSKTAAWLMSQGLPAPRTALASAASDCGAGPYFVKRRIGTGSVGARVLEASELETQLAPPLADWVVQEICHGPEITIDAFFDPGDSFCAVVCRERLEIKSGVSTKARLFADDELAVLAAQIARRLPIAGSFCFQVMRGAAGYVVTDLNLRPGAATAMSRLTGNDFFAAALALAWGESYMSYFQKLSREYYITRQYAEFVTG